MIKLIAIFLCVFSFISPCCAEEEGKLKYFENYPHAFFEETVVRLPEEPQAEEIKALLLLSSYWNALYPKMTFPTVRLSDSAVQEKEIVISSSTRLQEHLQRNDGKLMASSQKVWIIGTNDLGFERALALLHRKELLKAFDLNQIEVRKDLPPLELFAKDTLFFQGTDNLSKNFAVGADQLRGKKQKIHFEFRLSSMLDLKNSYLDVFLEDKKIGRVNLFEGNSQTLTLPLDSLQDHLKLTIKSHLEPLNPSVENSQSIWAIADIWIQNHRELIDKASPLLAHFPQAIADFDPVTLAFSIPPEVDQELLENLVKIAASVDPRKTTFIVKDQNFNAQHLSFPAVLVKVESENKQRSNISVSKPDYGYAFDIRLYQTKDFSRLFERLNTSEFKEVYAVLDEKESLQSHPIAHARPNLNLKEPAGYISYGLMAGALGIVFMGLFLTRKNKK